MSRKKIPDDRKKVSASLTGPFIPQECGNDEAERFRLPDGTYSNSTGKHNRSKMAEIGKVIFIVTGTITFLVGLLANLDNWISVALGVLGIFYGFYMVLTARENMLTKRIDRRLKELEYKKQTGQK